MDDKSLDRKVKAIKEVTSLFRLERFVYVSVIIICLIIMIASVVVALFKGKVGIGEITSIFGSSGAISVMTGRLVHMWNRAITLLDNSNS